MFLSWAVAIASNMSILGLAVPPGCRLPGIEELPGPPKVPKTMAEYPKPVISVYRAL